MASEETPLLATENRRDDVYLRFSSVRKNVILMMVSGCGLINSKFISFGAQCSALGVPYLLINKCSSLGPLHLQYHRSPKIWNQQGPSSSKVFSEKNPSYKKRIHCFFSMAVSISVLAMSLGGLIAASYSTFCKWIWASFSALVHELKLLQPI